MIGWGARQINTQRATRHPWTSARVTPQPGETLLVGVTREDDPRCLAVASWAPASQPRVPTARRLALAEELDEVVRTAASLAWQHAPWCLHPIPPRVTGKDVAARLVIEVGLDTKQIAGASYGLALLLGAQSYVTGHPLPDHVVALAEVARDGALRPVASFSAKLDLLAEHAPALTTVWCHEEQADEARSHPRGWHVEALRSVSEASTLLWDPDALARSVGSGRRRALIARRLARWARTGHPSVHDWSPVARTLASVRDLPDLPDALRHDLRFALRIAERHTDVNHLVEWPEDAELERMARPLRLEYLAHVVQSWSDADGPEPQAAIERALRWLGGPLSRHAGDLMVLGACGRLLAAHGHLEAAAGLLEDAVDGWEAIDRFGEASHALCELVRVRGLQRAVDLEPLEERVELCKQEANDPLTHGFLMFALGRAMVLSGRTDDGARTLEPLAATWREDPLNYRRGPMLGGYRWWCRATGDWSTLLPDHGEGAEYGILQRMDRALAVGADAGRFVAALRELQPRRVAQISRWAPAEGDAAAHLADAWPY